MEDSSKTNRFSIVKRAKSFTFAGRGIFLLIKTTHNVWLHIAILIFAVITGFYLGISIIEWILLVLCASIVLTAEAFNTAIEIDIDLTSPEYHPFARDTKDVAAGAVLISSIAACIIGLLIFIPHIIDLFNTGSI